MQNLTELFPCFSETDEGYDTFRYEEELKARYGLLEDDSSEEDEQPVNKKVRLIINVDNTLSFLGFLFKSFEYPQRDEEEHDIKELL